MLTGDDPHLTSLLVGQAASPEHELAALYAPLLRFDQREPFLPLAAGYTIFGQSGPSPSFPRTIEVGPGEQVVEYAIWWDWDIVHLYELEHVWVYLDSRERPARAKEDKLVQAFLRRHAFVPSNEFNRKQRIPSERLVPWPKLFRWIPERVSYLAEGLQDSVRLKPAPFELLECERVP
jgi:hypothetical protein